MNFYTKLFKNEIWNSDKKESKLQKQILNESIFTTSKIKNLNWEVNILYYWF